jgi:hypothetical protein
VRRGLAAVATVFVVAGCSSGSSIPTHRLIGFDFVTNDVQGWTELVTLDPHTLRRHGRLLRFDDAVTADQDSAATSPVGQLSPDRKTLAVGGSSGRILLVDPARLRRIGPIRLPPGNDVVDVDSWPRGDRLLVVYGRFSIHSTRGDSLAVVNPVDRTVVRRVRLHGFVDHAEKLRDGGLVLTVDPVRAGRPARLMIVSVTGGLRSVRLDADAPWVATDLVGRAFAVADGWPIEEVDLRTLHIRRHRVALTTSSRGLPQPPPFVPGSTEPRATRQRTVDWLGHGLLGISGGLDRVVRTGARLAEQHTPYRYQVVDTRTWRTVRTFALTSCEGRFGLYLCSSAVGGFAPDGKGSRGSSLVVYDRSWKQLYRKPSPYLWRDEVAGRFLAGSLDGSRMSVLDPRSGRVLRRLGAMRVWPPDLLDWSAG